MLFSRIVVRLALLLGVVSMGVWYFLKPSPQRPEDKYVNVYCWYGLIDQETIKEFEHETGITVRMDSYDNNEVLEAKLLASNSGFDVVFPSASPYVAWQIQAQVYQPLNKELLPNIENIDQSIIKFMREIDKDLTFALPYFWGTVGIVYNVDVLNKVFPNGFEKNLDLLFDPAKLAQLAPYGVSLLEEGVDVIPFALLHLKFSPSSSIESELTFAANHLMQMRPYVKRFTSAKVVNDIVLGDTAIALTWSGEAQQAINEAKEQGKNIEFLIPPEGAILWIDAVAIPQGAPHPKNAHAFINFLLQPHVAARICKNSLHGVAVNGLKQYLPSEIYNNSGVFPDKSVLKKLFLNTPPKNETQMRLERERTRVWAKIRLNEYKHNK
jgi:putrescine transport system substrate-binding protein